MSRSIIPSGVLSLVALACFVLTGPALLCHSPWRSFQPKPVFTPVSRYPVMEVALQAIRLSDDEGDRTARISAEEVGEWVRAANEIFGESGIRFRYDPAENFAELDSTLLDTMDSIWDEGWEEEISLGDSVAGRYPGHLVVFFRHGPPDFKGGEGFSWLDMNFVAMPGFDQEICGGHYRGMLAHEIGHYLGLSHTFTQSFTTAESAETFFVRFGREPMVFDGDALADTPPDPFVEGLVCGREESLVLDGMAFPLPVENVMSYYASPTGLSAQQAAVARWALAVRQEHGMAMPTNEDAPFCVEAENLELGRLEGGVAEAEVMGWFWQEGDQFSVNADSPVELELLFHAARTGRYRIALYMAYAPDYGQVRIGVDGGIVGEILDSYAPLLTISGPVELGELDLHGGEHTLNLAVVGRNEASGGYSLGIDCLSIVPLE